MRSSSLRISKIEQLILITAIVFAAVLATGCAHTVPDVPVCYEMAPTRGTCVMTISGRDFDVDEDQRWPLDDAWKGKSWWDVRHMMLSVPGEVSWVPMRAFIIKICKDKNTCQQEVKNWERTVRKIDERPAP